MMRKDEFASINATKKRGSTFVILIAVLAICLAGILCAWKLQAEGSKVLMETGNVSAEQ